MAYLVRCLYRDGGDRDRLAIRADHIRHMLAWLPRTVFGSAMVDDRTARPLGMVVALDVESRADAERFIESEPYHRAGLFRSVEITQLKVMTPPHTPESLERELAREEACQPAHAAHAAHAAHSAVAAEGLLS